MADQRNLGRRYVCFKCGCKFYDLNQPEPLCPRCGADQRENPNPDAREAFLARYRRPSGGKSAEAKKKKKAQTDEETLDGVDADMDDDEDLLDGDFDDEDVDDAAPEDDDSEE